MKLRRAVSTDAAALSELGETTFTAAFGTTYRPHDLRAFLDEAYSSAYYDKRLADPRVGIWVVADDQGRLMAFGMAGACALPVPDLEPAAGEIKRLYVRAEAQGQQMGSRILDVMLEWLAQERFAPLYVGVWSQNPGAQRLYGRYGFRKVGEYEFPVGEHRDHEFILKRE